MTGVAVEVFVQTQFGALIGSTLLSNTRRHRIVPLVASIAARVFDCARV
jgi:hypothetical protein